MVEMKMTANYYGSRDYARTDVKRGVTRNRGGTRILSLTSDFLIGLRNALVFECGSAADIVMKSAGKRWGRTFAARMSRELEQYYGLPVEELPLAVFQGCLVEAFNVHGLGKLTVDIDLYTKGLIVCIVENPIYAGMVETSGQPADIMLAGILAGMVSHFSGRELDCFQTQCQGLGAPDSRFIITLPERLGMAEAWRNEGKTHAEIVAALAQTHA